MPGASSQLQAAVVDGKLYAISGFATDRMGKYDPATNSWTTVMSLPANLRQNFGRVVLNRKIYVIGGYGFFGANPVNTNFVYDPTADIWAADDPMPTKRADVTAVNLQGKIYVIGGTDINTVPLPTVQIFDPSQPTGFRWSTGPHLPAPRAKAAAGVIGGKIYLFGGVDVNGTQLTTGLVFDPSTNHWSSGTPRLPDMPIMGTGHSTVLSNKLFIVGCGAQSKQVQAFDPSSNSWDTAYPQLPTGRDDCGVASDQMSQRIYAVGGGDESPLDELDILSLAPTPPVITNQTDLDFLSTNEVFDPLGSGANPWTTASRMPTARAAFGIAAANGKIYAGGGSVTDDCSTPVGILEAYDPATDTWTTLPPMPTPRLHVSAAASDGDGSGNSKIYFIGGQVGCGEILENPPVDTVESFDPQSGTWNGPLSPMPTKRTECGIGVINSKIYVVGGRNGNGEDLDILEVFDPAQNSGMGAWATLAPMPTPRAGVSVAVVNNILYAIGGFDSSLNSVNAVEAYNPETGSWTEAGSLSPLPTPRNKLPGVGVINNIIYVFGGSNRFAELSINEAYDPSTDTWSTAPALPTARFGLGGAVVRNSALGRDEIFAIGGHLQGIATVGQLFVYQITATNHPISYSLDPATPLPPGLTLDSDSGLIFGIPTKKSHDNLVTAMATNASGSGSASLQFSVKPSAASGMSSGPAIVSNSSATGRTGQFFKFQVIATNVSLSPKYEAGGLPSGLTIDPDSGLISGTTDSAGNFAVSLSVTDGRGTANSILQLTFVDDPNIPIITSLESVTLVPGQPFTYKIVSAGSGGADVSLSYIGDDGLQHSSASTGGLPQGLSFDGANTISGVYSPGMETNRARENKITLDGGSRTSTITIRPRLITSAQSMADSSDGPGTRPLNFLQPATVSRKTQGGSDAFDIDLPLTGNAGIECRSGGANNAYQLVVILANPVIHVGNIAVTSGAGKVASSNVSGNEISMISAASPTSRLLPSNSAISSQVNSRATSLFR